MKQVRYQHNQRLKRTTLSSLALDSSAFGRALPSL
ncbi:hypothetical protein P4O66_011696, partial [Electrophorus voltai]